VVPELYLLLELGLVAREHLDKDIQVVREIEVLVRMVVAVVVLEVLDKMLQHQVRLIWVVMVV
jgi:hypothetical protein